MSEHQKESLIEFCTSEDGRKALKDYFAINESKLDQILDGLMDDKSFALKFYHYKQGALYKPEGDYR